jgi:hypothetical protein
MIKTIFPTRILIKDYDKSEEWSQNLEFIVRSIFKSVQSEKEDYSLTGDNSINLFKKENLIQFPELIELREMFVDCFYELASSYDSNELTRDFIDERVDEYSGKLPFMRNGDLKLLHNHNQSVDAFGIFYLTDVDNAKDGGSLILHDPSFSGLFNFQEERMISVETKRNRMVICPNHVWHEVSRYTGQEERITITVDLCPHKVIL